MSAESQFAQMIQGIATARGLYPGAVRAHRSRRFLDRGPASPTRRYLAYRDEVYAQVRAQVGEQAKLLFLRSIWRAPGASTLAVTIALIYGVGPCD